jgi:hypothetical protein
LAACGVDLAHHALPYPRCIFAGSDGADKFMSKHPVKSHVAVGYFYVGIANAHNVRTDKGFSWEEFWFLVVCGKT